MIKVVEVISDKNIGGAGVLLLNRLRHTDKSRFCSYVIMPKGSLLAARTRALGARVREIPMPERSFGVPDTFKIAAELKRIKPSLVNSHASLSSRIAAAACGVPVRIYTRHCVFPLSKIYKCSVVRAASGALCCLLSHKVIAVAHAAARDLCSMGIPRGRIQVIINGACEPRCVSESEKAELRQRLGIQTAQRVVIICGRLERCKGQDVFLKAAALLRREHPELVFLIVGDGKCRDELLALCRRAGIEESVRFVGFVADVAPYMSISALNVNCSRGTETSSLALSEGMSMGIPCVASDYGGNPYMVRNGKNGYLFECGDHRALATAILRALEPSNYSALCRGARARFENELNAKKMTADTEWLYLRMLRLKGVIPNGQA